MKDLKLYMVEFGKPSVQMFSVNTCTAFVMAKSYDEAAEKAMLHMANKPFKGNVLTDDGSINPAAVEELMVKSVKLVCEEIVY